VLNQYHLQETPPPRSLSRERRLWQVTDQLISPLGCGSCPEQSICGALRIKTPVFDCLDFCCRNPKNCDNVCRSHPDYVDRVREVGGFSLETVPRGPAIAGPLLPRIVPMIFHGSRRDLTFAPPAVALSLYQMFDRRDGRLRFASREALCASYRIAGPTEVILSGTDCDASVERWWGLEERQRRRMIQGLHRIGVALVTTPNYSMFTDVPRWNDLHAIKRIALVHHELICEGVAAALHINGRTETDFRRWADFVNIRPEVTHLAYEFTTGTRWAGRREQHVAWLCELANAIKRPLHLIVRGGAEIVPELARAFSVITVLETVSFIKTMMRHRAESNGNSHLRWISEPTSLGAPLDVLFAHNIAVVRARLEQLTAGQSLAMSEGA